MAAGSIPAVTVLDQSANGCEGGPDDASKLLAVIMVQFTIYTETVNVATAPSEFKTTERLPVLMRDEVSATCTWFVVGSWTQPAIMYKSPAGV